MFVRIRLPIGEPYKARLVLDRVIQSDQDRKYVYVLDSSNKAQYRQVTTGALQRDGLRVIEGVGADEWIVVSGLQQVHPNTEIVPQQVPMPTLRPQVTDKGTK